MRIRRSLRGGPRRRWFTLLVSFAALLACVSPATAAGAAGSPFRRLAASTVAFASDGTRYVAWQTRVGAPVVVFDARTGAQRRLDLPDGCELCGFEPDDSRQLDVHHLDEDKANNDPSNLQTVCANCHRNLKHVGSRLKSK